MQDRRVILQAIRDVSQGTHSNYLREFGSLICDYQEVLELQQQVAQRMRVPEEQLDSADLLDSLVLAHRQTVQPREPTPLRAVTGHNWAIQKNLGNMSDQSMGTIIQLELLYSQQGREQRELYEMTPPGLDALIAQLE